MTEDMPRVESLQNQQMPLQSDDAELHRRIHALDERLAIEAGTAREFEKKLGPKHILTRNAHYDAKTTWMSLDDHHAASGYMFYDSYKDDSSQCYHCGKPWLSEDYKQDYYRKSVQELASGKDSGARKTPSPDTSENRNE